VRYQVLLRPRAQKFLRELRDKTLLARVVEVLRELAENPRRVGSEKLSGPEELYRIRVGDYRILYQIQDDALLMLVVKIGHRREVYR
jgi:mRNA interferase RelE/StbE